MATESSSRPLNILHLASSERWTGVAEPVVSLAREQQRMGHRVWVGCVPGRSFERRARQRGVEIVPGLRLNRRMNPLHLISDILLLRKFCRKNRVDVVHAHLLHDHWLAATALRGIFAPKGRNPLLLRTLHGSAAPRNDWYHRRLFLKYTDRFVCVSGDAARRAEATLGMRPGSVPYVGGGVDLDRFKPGLDPLTIRSELGIPADAPAMGLVARMRAGRGLRWLMEAIPLALERAPEAYFFVVGRGELKHWFRDEIRKPAYKGRVKYAGYRTGDLPQAYAAMDAALFLGLGSEGTCRAVLEAMGCGRPVIGVAKGAVPEILNDGQTGLLAQDHDARDLADKIVEMMRDREKMRTMGEEARRRAEERMHESRRAEAFERIYRELVDSKGL